MSAQDNLSGLQFQHWETSDRHSIRAIDPASPQPLIEGSGSEPREVGFMQWSKHEAPGEIEGLFVDPRYRRRGIATQMYSAGQDYDPPAVHSDTRTHLGDKWARSVGGTLWDGKDISETPKVNKRNVQE